MQLFHISNAKRPGECCSGIRHWDRVQCLDAGGWSFKFGDHAIFGPCAWQGQKPSQQVALDDEGKLRWAGQGEGVPSTMCAMIGDAELDADYIGSPDSNCAKIEQRGTSLMLVAAKAGRERLCAAQSIGFEKPLTFKQAPECEDWNPTIVVEKSPTGSWLVRDTIKNACLDAGGGSNLQWYFCYPAEQKNLNQAYDIDKGRLVWGDSCIGAAEAGRKVGFNKLPSEPHVELRACVDKDDYQRWQVVPSAQAGNPDNAVLPGWKRGHLMAIREAKPDGKCIAVRGNGLVLRDCCQNCGERQLWQMHTNMSNGVRRLRHLGSGACLDANDMIKAIVYPCQDTLNKKQEFQLEEGRWGSSESKSVRLPRTFVDQGRTRFAPICLTAPGRPKRRLTLGACEAAGRWRKLAPFEPEETRAYREASKTWSED